MQLGCTYEPVSVRGNLQGQMPALHQTIEAVTRGILAAAWRYLVSCKARQLRESC